MSVSKRVRQALGLGLLLALGLPTVALACGMPLRARIPAEQALIVFANGQQQIITSLQLQIDEPGAAVIFPVPGLPQVDQPAGSEALFSYLEEATKPEEQVERLVTWGDSNGSTGGAPAGGVSLLGRETLGGYDVSRLAADDAQELARWLDQNGYSVPASAQAVFDSYIADNWKFVAIKLAQEDSSGSLAPLRISFPSQQIIYPMRFAALADEPLDRQIYVATDHRMLVENMQTLYAGPVTTLEPQPSAELSALLGGAPYLTKLRNAYLNPASVKGDFAVTQAPNDDPFREVQVVYERVSAVEAYGPALALVALASFSAIAIAFAIRRRLQRF